MKKIKKIVLALLTASFFSICCLGLYEIFKTSNSISEEIAKDPSLLILIGTTLFSFISFLFNVFKLNPNPNLESFQYKLLRFCDLIYAISLFIFLIWGSYNILKANNNGNLNENFWMIFLVLVVLYLLSISLILDNIFYHKKNKKATRVNFIEEIGK